jgi:hypothetical protein
MTISLTLLIIVALLGLLLGLILGVLLGAALIRRHDAHLLMQRVRFSAQTPRQRAGRFGYGYGLQHDDEC